MTWLLVLILAAGVGAPPTQAVALALAGILAIGSPLILKYVPWTGAQMTALTMLLALGVAVLASWLTGDLVLSREGVVSLLMGSSSVWAVQQIVYQGLKQFLPTAVVVPPAPSNAPPAPGPAPTTLA